MGRSPGTSADLTERRRSAFTPPDYHWPVAASALAALADLGMSDEAIARYFAVEREAVRALRQRHGIPDGAARGD
jgi:hypothetical protein